MNANGNTITSFARELNPTGVGEYIYIYIYIYNAFRDQLVFHFFVRENQLTTFLLKTFNDFLPSFRTPLFYNIYIYIYNVPMKHFDVFRLKSCVSI